MLRRTSGSVLPLGSDTRQQDGELVEPIDADREADLLADIASRRLGTGGASQRPRQLDGVDQGVGQGLIVIGS